MYENDSTTAMVQTLIGKKAKGMLMVVRIIRIITIIMGLNRKKSNHRQIGRRLHYGRV